MKQITKKVKFKAGEGMVRHLSTLAPNTKPQFIGFDFVDGEFVKNENKIEEIMVNRNNQHYYDLMVREGALIIVENKEKA